MKNSATGASTPGIRPLGAAKTPGKSFTVSVAATLSKSPKHREVTTGAQLMNEREIERDIIRASIWSLD